MYIIYKKENQVKTVCACVCVCLCESESEKRARERSWWMALGQTRKKQVQNSPMGAKKEGWLEFVEVENQKREEGELQGLRNQIHKLSIPKPNRSQIKSNRDLRCAQVGVSTNPVPLSPEVGRGAVTRCSSSIHGDSIWLLRSQKL